MWRVICLMLSCHWENGGSLGSNSNFLIYDAEIVLAAKIHHFVVVVLIAVNNYFLVIYLTFCFIFIFK